MISWVIPTNGTKMTSTTATSYHNHRSHGSPVTSGADAEPASRRKAWSTMDESGGESNGVPEERSRKRSAAQMLDAESAQAQPEESEENDRAHSTDSTVAADASSPPPPLPPSATSGGMESFLEAQKAFHRFTSQLSAGSAGQPQQQNNRNSNNNNSSNVNPFLNHLAGLPPIIAAVLQQQQQNIQQQLLDRGVESKALLNCHRQAAEAAAATASYLLGGGGDAGTTRYGIFAQENADGSVSGGGKIGKLAGTIGQMLSASRAAADADRQRRRGSATSSRRGSPTAAVEEEPSSAVPDDCGLYHHLMDDVLDEEEDDRTTAVNYCGVGGEPQDLRVDKRSDADDASSNSGTVGAVPGNWSYEEQFKQLYELSEDVKRKEWLDDWLNFMHRIGKPVTRIPIMAKQVLDLYELYHLVVRHGGLVEIINKKLWREITKGLNLPNSITSAAFTLRTQYQKYLYDYECEHENLSRLSDLTAAIEGNRRESRRTNPSDTPTNASMQSCHNGYDRNSIGVGLSRNQHSRNSANDYEDLNGTSSSAMSAAAAASGLFPYSLLGNGVPPMMATLLGKHIDNMKDSFATAESNCNPNLNVPFGSSHRQLEMFQRAAFDAMNASGQHHGVHTGTMGNASAGLNVNQHPASGRNSTSSFTDSDNGCCAAKKSRPDRFSSSVAHSFGATSNGNKTEKISKAANKSSNSSPHMKLTSCTNNDGSMVVSMEFNGVAYQGVLFATNNGSSSPSTPATRAPTSTTSTDNNDHYNNSNNVGEQITANVTLNSASEAAISAAATAAASKFFSSMLQNVAINAATTAQGGDTAFGNVTGTLQSSNADEAVDNGTMAADKCNENNDENSHVINFVAKDKDAMSTIVGDSESMEVVLKNNSDFGGDVESTTVESECGTVMEDLK